MDWERNWVGHRGEWWGLDPISPDSFSTFLQFLSFWLDWKGDLILKGFRQLGEEMSPASEWDVFLMLNSHFNGRHDTCGLGRRDSEMLWLGRELLNYFVWSPIWLTIHWAPAWYQLIKRWKRHCPCSRPIVLLSTKNIIQSAVFTKARLSGVLGQITAWKDAQGPLVILMKTRVPITAKPLPGTFCERGFVLDTFMHRLI